VSAALALRESALSVSSEAPLREAMQRIDKNRRGAVLVVDAEGRLLDLLTDGDLRRAVLAGVDLDGPVRSLFDRRAGSPYRAPVVARAESRPSEQRRLLRRHGIRHLPIVDGDDRVVDLVTLDELVPASENSFEAVVMAGGRGQRLRPLTDHTPKPMLPVGGRPLLEHTLTRLRDAGVQTVHITTHYAAEKITRYFGDGSGIGLDLHYLAEERPLGTAGSLRSLSRATSPILVINGDILTNMDFRSLRAFHQEQGAELTLAARHHEVDVPYGVVECRGARVTSLREKPRLSFFVNAGIYLVEPSALDLVPAEDAYQMTDLIDALIARNRRVASFPILEYWLDIGRPPDYQQAQADFRDGRLE
jgi:dTDP-glucose pyrophosphorylase/CBS domain-containing protein